MSPALLAPAPVAPTERVHPGLPTWPTEASRPPATRTTPARRLRPATDHVEGLTERSDAPLLRAVRAGDLQAVESLYARHYAYGVRAAGAIGHAGIAEDLAAEAFTKVVSALLNGRGPDHAFRPYLVTAIRHLFFDRVRKAERELTVDPTDAVMEVAEDDPSEQLLERGAVLEAMAELPHRWREVLWRTVVLEQPLATVGVAMGMKPNAVAALSFRARAGLSKAYLRRFAPHDDRLGSRREETLS